MYVFNEVENIIRQCNNYKELLNTIIEEILQDYPIEDIISTLLYDYLDSSLLTQLQCKFNIKPLDYENLEE